MGQLVRSRRAVVAIGLLVVLAAILLITSAASRRSVHPAAVPASRAGHGYVAPAGRRFAYGFDLAQQGPYMTVNSDPQAVASARNVIASVPGILEDTPIMDWGAGNPEPRPGDLQLSKLAARVRLIISSGGTPVITLCAAPRWMTGTSSGIDPPTPGQYAAFADLAATIARSFPQVKYFVVWNELKGFWNADTRSWDIAHYTDMYNRVYAAIKRVRPDALVGGPYVVTRPVATPQRGDGASVAHGPWGFLKPEALPDINYWLAHKVGADFVALDGADFPKSGPITDPLSASEMYAAINRWLRKRTTLPLWWMETHIEPAASHWTASQGAAIRIAALVRDASSGAQAALQWQPQEGAGISDEGLWTATTLPGGGRPTVLARLLPKVLSVLQGAIAIAPGQGSGVLVAKGTRGTIAINTTNAPALALLGKSRVALKPGQVRVTSAASSGKQ
jgi:hypothetical protein